MDNEISIVVQYFGDYFTIRMTGRYWVSSDGLFYDADWKVLGFKEIFDEIVSIYFMGEDE